MSEEFYERLYRRFITQIWLATGVMAVSAVIIAVILSRAVSSVDLHQLKSLIEASKCSCRNGMINNSTSVSLGNPVSREDTIKAIARDRIEKGLDDAKILH